MKFDLEKILENFMEYTTCIIHAGSMVHKLSLWLSIKLIHLLSCNFPYLLFKFVPLTVKELLPVHPSHMQREEAGAAPGQGHGHRGDHVWGRAQPPMREAHGGARPHPEAAPVPLPILINRIRPASFRNNLAKPQKYMYNIVPAANL